MVAEGCGLLDCSMATADMLCVCVCVLEGVCCAESLYRGSVPVRSLLLSLLLCSSSVSFLPSSSLLLSSRSSPSPALRHPNRANTALSPSSGARVFTPVLRRSTAVAVADTAARPANQEPRCLGDGEGGGGRPVAGGRWQRPYKQEQLRCLQWAGRPAVACI